MADEMKGTGEDAEKGQASGPKGGDSAKGKDGIAVTSDVPEKAAGRMNPSSPGNTGTTPGTNAKVG